MTHLNYIDLTNVNKGLDQTKRKVAVRNYLRKNEAQIYNILKINSNNC